MGQKGGTILWGPTSWVPFLGSPNECPRSVVLQGETPDAGPTIAVPKEGSPKGVPQGFPPRGTTQSGFPK
jgi:hypothetical protein